MDDIYFNIQFDHDGVHYDGIVTPSDKLRADGTPKSFHVVLNNVFFGNLNFHQSKWNADEQRPQALVEMVGRRIESHYQPKKTA